MTPRGDQNDRIHRLSPVKQSLLEKRLEGEFKDSSESRMLRPRPDQKRFPLSFGQERFWFLEQLAQGKPAHNRPIALRLTGLLNQSAMQHAINEILQRHEVLRAIFPTMNGLPIQIISPVQTQKFSVIDLSRHSPNERKDRAMHQIAKEVQRPFDLSQGPLLRANLLLLNKEEHILLLVIHHIAFDGWSEKVFIEELKHLYGAFSKGSPSSLPELPVQYADYAYWQRQRLEEGRYDNQIRYWKKQLDGIPSVLKLPTDRPRPSVQTFRSGREIRMMSKTLSAAIKVICREEDVTLYMLLLAAIQTLLYRYTHQKDIVVGSPIAGRNRLEIEPLIGFFVNTLVMRTDFSGNPTFREILRQVRGTAVAAYSHQDIPFEKLVEVLQPDRSLNRSPLFQVFFNMQNDQGKSLDLLNLHVESFIPDEESALFDLTIYAHEQRDTIQIDCLYSKDLFDAARIVEMVSQFEFLLEQIANDADRKVTAYSLVSPNASNLLPNPREALAEPSLKPVLDFILESANRVPEHNAIRFGKNKLTYKELWHRKDIITSILVQKGMQKGDVAAICGHRSIGTITAILGVLSGGGLILLLDPELPEERKKTMLKVSRTKYLIDVCEDRKKITGNANFSNLEQLQLDADSGYYISEKAVELLDDISPPEINPNDAAYIFFTSGTTSEPNAILGDHKGISHFIKWQGQTFNIGKNDRVAQITNLAFDMVLRDVFLPLTHGATLCIPTNSERRDPLDLLDWMANERITILHIVPTLAQCYLADIPPEKSLSTLRWVFFAGEPLQDTLVNSWRQHFPECQIVNFYGPTETTMIKCFYQVPKAITTGNQPIGQPLPQTQALILSEKSRLCGIGEPGEIVIRTPFLTRGYINASKTENERFIKNPYRNDNKDILFCTGDIGRYRPDGLIDILGRTDDQVKIRGVRIEPDGVAAVLSQHPDIIACTVVSRVIENSHPILVAYIVTKKQDKRLVRSLNSYLFIHLPGVMIPSEFIFLDKLPRTPNGKLDRGALAEIHQARFGVDTEYVAPRTECEKAVARIWAEIIGLGQVGIHNNFFRLGGHSFSAMQVTSRIRATFQLDFPLHILFEAPTVAELCDLIELIQLMGTDSA